MSLKHIGVITALFMIGLARSFAQATGAGPELLDSASPSYIRSLLKSMNIQFVESTKEDTITFELKLDGQNSMLIAGKADLYLSLALAGRAQVDRINLWNARHRLARAYVDSNGAPHLDADLDASHGVTRGAVEAFIRNFGSTARLFSSEFANLSGPVSAGQNQTAPRTRIGLPYGEFALWINPQEWAQAETQGGALLFRQLHGDGYAMVITEPGVVPNGLSALKTVILSNTRKNTPDINITLDDKRMVNDHEVLVLGMEGTVTGIPIRYLTNSYSGPSGTILVLTYTSKDAFEKNLSLFTEFLNGLEINESPLDSASGADNDSGPGRLTLVSGKAVIDFEKSKWKLQSSRIGRYVLTHNSGVLFSQVITEGLTFPPDRLLEIALANMKREAPDAKATFQGKVVVNGNNMVQVNIDATIQGLPLSYQNYYYSGTAGTIQIMTWTKKGDRSKYEKDVAAFMNGFRVLE